jgi:hypothetical protein
MRKVISMVTAAAVGVGVWAGAARAAVDARGTKREGAAIRLASATPVQGFDAVSAGDSRLYVAPKGGLTAADVTSATSIEVREGRDVELTLTRDAAAKLASSMRETGANRLAIFEGGRLIASGVATVDSTVSRAVIRSLSSDSADRLIRLVDVRAVPEGPAVRMTASQQAVEPGGTVTVELRLDAGVAGLRAYQFVLVPEGGTRGQLTLQSGAIDATRTDFVFAGRDKLDAVDQTGIRMMSALVSGSLNVARESYLGQFTFVASPDAQGTFKIRVDAADGNSILLDTDSRPITVAMPQPVEVSVGAPTRVAPTRR